MIRVLLVSPLPPPEGGIATWTRTLIDRGLPGDIELEVINTRVTRAHFSKTGRPTPSEILRNWKIVSRVRSVVRSGRFDVMHINHGSLSSNGMFRDYLVGRMARSGNLPYVVQLRGNLDVAHNQGPLGKMRLKAYRGLFNRSAAVLPLNTPTKDAVLTLAPGVADRCEIIPNFISSDEIPQRPSEIESDPGILRIVFAGSLIRTKGMSDLLDIVRRVEGVHLTLIGGAAAERDLQFLENFRHESISHKVTLVGSLPNADVLQALTRSDVFCFPSHTEGFPISVLEAMFVGLPVVASTVGAIPDMIDVPQGGVLCSPKDTDGFVAAIEKLRDSPTERREMGRYNREKALRNYDYASVSRRLADLYESIANKR